MLQTLRNAWKVEDLRKKILFTLLIILLYRLGNAIPVPYVNKEALELYFEQVQGTMLGLYNMMSGGASPRPPSLHCPFSPTSTPPSSSSCSASPSRLWSG